jgi:hypothetical protein
MGIDKRLRPAKVIGIILFILSIVSFGGNIMGGLFSLIIPYTQVFEHGPVFSENIDWIFRHYTLCAFSFSIIWIPLFFGARALYKFKEWGRVVCIIMLFVLMCVMVCMAYLFAGIQHFPPPFVIMFPMIFIVYVIVLIVPVYFLIRRSTKEGIKDYQQSNR